ncbi:MAG: hypothetical protein ACI81L_003649 [Verrucomicrobiales bacterium]|jgi:hypothetical protein
MGGGAFIGGNLQSISESASRLDASGAMAITTATRTKGAADSLEAAVTAALNDLVRSFGSIADGMSEEIASSHRSLVGADWQGASRDNAVAIKEHLQGQVRSVLGSATDRLEAERNAFVARASELVASVETDFKRVMHDVDAEYSNLARASRRTMENLAAADQTIAIG